MTRKALDPSDVALLAAFILTAGLGIWNNCLLFNDGAVLLSAGWLGDAWDLYFNQIAGRAVSTFVTFGPAWAARRAFNLSSGTYIILAHALYFAVPLGLWLAIRAVEPQRAFSRLYLAIMLVLVYFPTELIVGVSDLDSKLATDLKAINVAVFGVKKACAEAVTRINSELQIKG